MQSPYFDCIGLLTSSRIGVRSPSTIEVEKVVEGALATGTFLEINSQPDRLDLRFCRCIGYNRPVTVYKI